MSMYSKNNVLKKSCCNMYMLNIVLWGRQRQTLNGYFSVNNGNNFNFNCNEKAETRKWCIFKMVTNAYILTVKIDFSILRLRSQIYVILSSALRTNL